MPLTPPAPSAAARRAAADAWFAGHTFRAEDFADLDRLAALKRRRGVTVSLGLPALNEEVTIGDEIAVLQRTLMREVPLLDEIAVIDSGSLDRTAAVSRALGVRVYQHADVLPETGTFDGKGEALWKSLHVLRGDLVAWLDTDIRNIHPRFVYGLLGPLLHDPRIGYVKGYYRRPLRDGTSHSTAGGGRVTELTARPLLNLLFPELSGVIQPLAGEYAGRRALLERLPFFTGYGVEAGHLIDLLNLGGLDLLAQVDLGTRLHRNRDLALLAPAAFAVVQVVIARAGVPVDHAAMTRVRLHPEPSVETRLLREHERPPIVTVPAYRARRSAAPEMRQPARMRPPSRPDAPDAPPYRPAPSPASPGGAFK